MTPGVFEYYRPNTVGQALELIGRFGGEGKVLAGGHSLIPMMKLRLAEPAHLIDINRIAELRGIREDGDAIVIARGDDPSRGSGLRPLGRQVPPRGPRRRPRSATPRCGNCGTVGGNCANGDPGQTTIRR